MFVDSGIEVREPGTPVLSGEGTGIKSGRLGWRREGAGSKGRSEVDEAHVDGDGEVSVELRTTICTELRRCLCQRGDGPIILGEEI